MLEAVGMREQLSGEAQDLARLVERRLAQIEWGDHPHAVDELEVARAFLTHRFAWDEAPPAAVSGGWKSSAAGVRGKSSSHYTL